MSSTPTEIADGGGSVGLPYEYSGHTDCDSPLGVVVHQDDGSAVRLPVVDDGLQLYERKVGPTAITRRAEVTIPIEGLGDPNWTRYVNSFSTPDQVEGDRLAGPTSSTGIAVSDPVPSDPSIQTADVIGQPIDDSGSPVGEPSALFRGYIAAVGSREGTNRARFRIYDPMKFLNSIEAGMRFEAPAPKDVLREIRDTYVDNQPVFNDISIDTAGENTRLIRGLLAERGIFTIDFDDTDDFSREDLPTSFSDKLFTPNRDTLADVVEWFQKIGRLRVWFQPSGERGLTLTAAIDDASEYDLTPSNNSTPPYVIQNNALYEMRPLTSLRVKGAVGLDIPLTSQTVNTPFHDRYPEATATYPPLVKRFGGELEQTTTSNVNNTEEAEQTAAKQLKEALDDVSGGSMITTLGPMCRPFDRVRSTPACAGVTADVDPLRYEIQEAVHSVVPSDDNLPRSELSVSMSVDSSLIETESTFKDVQTGKEPTDSAPTDDYNWGYGPGAP